VSLYGKIFKRYMKYFCQILISIFLSSSSIVVAEDYVNFFTMENLSKNSSQFYTSERLSRMGLGFLSMGLVANSSVDQKIQDWYQQDIRDEKTDLWSKRAKRFGEGEYLLPLALLAGGLCYRNRDLSVGRWGLNAAHAYLVGLPPMWTMQYMTGGSRPNESDDGDSHWQPTQDDNGVSGHAFVGAVPFLTLAKMANNQKPLQYLAYAMSVLTAWSRVNDNAHYTSQAILGWYMAYESVDAVFDRSSEADNLTVSPMVSQQSYGLVFRLKW